MTVWINESSLSLPKLKVLIKELKTLNSKKGISTLEGILIGIGALGIGLAF